MPHGLKTQSMVAKEPVVVIAGLENLIKRDLEKHKALLVQSRTTLNAFKVAVSHQIKMKKHYKSLIGGGKFDGASLRRSMVMFGVNIRHLSDKVKFAEEAIVHHSLIVDTLTLQLADQCKKLDVLAEFRESSDASND